MILEIFYKLNNSMTLWIKDNEVLHGQETRNTEQFHAVSSGIKYNEHQIELFNSSKQTH